MAFTITRVCFIAILICTCVFSIAVLALKVSSLNFITANYETGGFEISLSPTPQNPEAHRMLGSLPLYLFKAPTKLAIAVSTLSTLFSLPGLAFTLFFWPDGKRVRNINSSTDSMRNNETNTKIQTYKISPRKILPFIYIINTILVLSAFIYLSLTHTQSTHFNASYTDSVGSFGPGGYYTGGKFDLETWVCDLAAFPGIGDQFNQFDLQCDNESAGRWELLGLFFSSLVTAGVAFFWALGRDENCLRRDEEGLNKGQALGHSDGWDKLGDSQTHGLEDLPRERFVSAS
ncbi:MAG: hypothetical protein M1812_007788 [Candelaria pacifica]|nr:MAG: hypothetical protein M1812_007788 [Candelaria pacifica]